MLQPSSKQLQRDEDRSSMRLIWIQPCSWMGSPKLQGDCRQKLGASLAVAHEININDSMTLAVSPSQWTTMPGNGCNGRFISRQELNLWQNHRQFFLIWFSGGNFSVRQTWISWAGGREERPTNRPSKKFLFLVSHRRCAILPVYCQLALSKELSPSSTWWQKGCSGYCCGHCIELRGTGIKFLLLPFCMSARSSVWHWLASSHEVGTALQYIGK